MNLPNEQSPIYRFLKPLLVAAALVMVIYGISQMGDLMSRTTRKQREQRDAVDRVGVVEYDKSPDAIIIQLHRRSPNPTPERSFIEDVPIFTLFGDGRAVYKQIGGSVWRETKLTDREVSKVVENARVALSIDVYSLQERISQGRLTVRDMDSVSVQFNTAQYRLFIIIYGLPRTVSSIPDHLADESTLRLVEFISLLDRFDESLPFSEHIRLTEAEIMVETIEEIPPGVVAREVNTSLPLDDVRREKRAVIKVTGDDLRFFVNALGAPGNFEYFVSKTGRYKIGYRPVIK